MSEVILTTIITGIVTLITVIITNKSTANKMMNELDKKTIVQEQEIKFIKSEISEMKDDIKAHNHYARMFQESNVMYNERYNNLEKRIGRLEN